MVSRIDAGSAYLTSAGFAYDRAGRLGDSFGRDHSATYNYLTDSPLVGNIVFKQGTTERMTTRQDYDKLSRLTVTSGSNAVSEVFAWLVYTYNDANQRIEALRSDDTDNSRWVYGYDKLGQLTSGRRYWTWGNLQPVAGGNFVCEFDDIGNRTRAGSGGWGATPRYTCYTANELNQYTQRLVPGVVGVAGRAAGSATVTVNGQAAIRQFDYFWIEAPVNNETGAVYQAIATVGLLRNGTNADIVTTNITHAFVPKTVEVFSCDLDGNLTADGRWTNRWDGENRLIEMESLAWPGLPAEARFRLVFAYDYQGRRISKTVSNWTGSAWAFSYQRKFVYDDWNLVAELDGNNNPVRSYLWGLDLSGSLQGAGGVGGLLAINDVTNGTHFLSYDGNGNVTALVDGSDGTVSANYEYGTFGEVIRASGDMAKLNPFRFSTKYQDDETDLLYYGYRYYDPNTGRWPNRDPITEKGGLNLFAFVRNDSVNKIDAKGHGVWWDCVACGAALIGKLGGSIGGCLWGCLESKSDLYPFGTCMDECIANQFTPCTLWERFKENPGEWVGAAACVSCGVRAIVNIPTAKPPGCGDCPPPKPPWVPRICWYACGSGQSGFITSRTETYPGEFDGGCPTMQVAIDGSTVDCISIGPFPNDWPPVPPSPPPGEPPPRQ